MPRVKNFDLTGSDPAKALPRNFEPPKPGVYSCVVDEITDGFAKAEDGSGPDKNKPMLTTVLRVTKGESKGYPAYHYLRYGPGSDNVLWKLDQFLQAVGELDDSKKRKAKIDLDKLIGMPVKVRFYAKTENGTYRAEIGAVMPPTDDDIPEDEEILDPDAEPSGDADLEGEGDEEITEEYLQSLIEDEDNEENLSRLSEIAAEYGIDSNEVPTWAEVVEQVWTAVQEGGGDEDDLEALGANADAEDQESIDRLTELAGERSLDPDEYGTWAELAEAITAHDAENPF